MRHLTAEELMDLAEGALDGRQAAHVEACEACRRQVADLRAALVDLQGADVPEPSPFFWAQLSANVRDRVAAEAGPGAHGWNLWLTSWRGMVAATACAAVLVAAVLATRDGRSLVRQSPGQPVAPALSAVASPAGDANSDPNRDLAASDDAPFRLMGDVTADLDWEDAAAAGLATPGVAIDRAVGELNAAERLELQRLLSQELSGSGA